VALKILKNIITTTKSSVFINLFLKCQMWKFFTHQFRTYLKNQKQSPNLIYTQNYFVLLEDMLESFNREMGMDS
jgi:hypothetical protein